MKGPWETLRRITVEGTERLLRLAREAGVRRFVHTSSVMVYDKRRLANGQQIDESWPLLAADPAGGPYARSKIEFEHVVRHVYKSAGDGDRRPARGPGVRARTRLLEHLGALVGRRLVAVGGGAQLLPLVHVEQRRRRDDPVRHEFRQLRAGPTTSWITAARAEATISASSRS